MRSINLKKNDFRRLSLENLEGRSLLAADFVPGELFVQYEPAVFSGIASISRAQNVKIVERRDVFGNDSLDVVKLSVSKDMDLLKVAQEYAKLPGVVSVDPNWITEKFAVSNDPGYSQGWLWGMYSDDSPAQFGGPLTGNVFGSGAEEAWGANITGSSQVVIAVLDSGVDINHEDLRQNIWVNPGEIPGNGKDDDKNGFIDDVNGWDFINNDNSVFDGISTDPHGTHVAGTLGAVGGNGIGVAGVAWNVKILPLRTLDSNGRGTADQASQAIEYLTKLKANQKVNIVAMNNSWGISRYEPRLHAAVINAANEGILCIAAAGNGLKSTNYLGTNNDIMNVYPASFSTLEPTIGTAPARYESVISVAAIDSVGELASFSNFGFESVDIAAPGVEILSTVPGNRYENAFWDVEEEGWAPWSGTSMAAPHVTGAVALYAAAKPDASPSTIREAILRSATPTTSLSGRTATGGRLSVMDAINYTAWPTVSVSSAQGLESVNGTAGWINFDVSISDELSESFSVNFATSNGTAIAGSDYGAASGTLTFRPGETTQRIRIELIDDNRAESNENFFIRLSDLSTASARLGSNPGVGTILNDDTPQLIVNDVTSSESAGTFQFTVSLTAVSQSRVTVRVATADGAAKSAKNADYTSFATTLTFNPGETSKTISVRIRNDRKAEQVERFFVNLSRATGVGILDSQGVGTIIDDDGKVARTSLAGLSLNSMSESDWDDLFDEKIKRRFAWLLLRS